MPTDDTPLCRGCRHLRVTYDPSRPWACRVHGFASRRLPSVVVLESSGRDCLAREPRPARVGRRRGAAR